MDDTEDDGKNEIDKITGSETLENRECLVSEDFVSMKRSRYAETESIPEKAVKKCFLPNLVRIQQMSPSL